jgi:hypothetical protein
MKNFVYDWTNKKDQLTHWMNYFVETEEKVKMVIFQNKTVLIQRQKQMLMKMSQVFNNS